MLSRVACVPRVCLRCRIGLFQIRAALNSPTRSHQTRWVRQKSFPGDPVVQSKERIEALISGRPYDAGIKKPSGKGREAKTKEGKTKAKSNKKRGSTAKSRGKQKGKKKGKDNNTAKGKGRSKRDEDLPDWGLFPSKKEAKAKAATEERINIIEPVAAKPAMEEEAIRQEDHVMEEETAAEEEPVTQAVMESSGSEELAKADPIPPTSEQQQPELQPSQEAITENPRKERKREFRDRLLHKRDIGVQALGQPMEALMMKNPNTVKPPRRPSRMLEEQQREEAVNLQWQDFVPKHEEPNDIMDEAMRNIEELRPVDTNTLRIEGFDQLANQLIEGFTGNQLMAYFHRRLAKAAVEGEEMPKYDWVVEQKPWETSRPDHWGDWKVLKMKQRYTVMIIKAIWKIAVQEQVEGLGLMQIWLKREAFELITRPSSSVLRSLASKYLYGTNRERIESSGDQGRLDIFTRKSIVPVILARLDETISSMTSETVSTSRVDGKDLDPRTLQHLARITNTLIQHDEENAELKVIWLANDHHAGGRGTESPADIVLRLLMGRQHEGLETTVEAVASETKQYRFIGHQRETKSMSWREKLQPWSRYVSPIGKPTTDAAELIEPKTLSLPETITEAARHNITSALTATFGHVLHNKPPGPSKGKPSHKSPRILSPVVPHPAALTALTQDAAPIAQHISIILHFSPSPARPTRFSRPIPHMRLSLPVNPDADLSAFSFPPESTLCGVVPRHVHDVLLPGESVDVRFSQEDVLPLDADQESLKEFLGACDFNLMEGRLRTPSHIRLAIPSWWMTKTRRQSSRMTNVEYQFMGLEIHQAVEVEWRGHTLRYNNIEAGHGGQRQELCLQAGPEGRDGFAQLVQEVASGKHFSWTEGYKAMQQPVYDVEETSFEEDDVPSLEEDDAMPSLQGEVRVEENGQGGDQQVPEKEAGQVDIDASDQDENVSAHQS